MRDLPLDLQEKINKKHQTIYENANPELKVLLSSGFNKELFRVYTIHEKELITDIDVTAKRSEVAAEPDKVYVAYVEDGTAHVKSKDLPYDELTPWDYEFELGSATNVAIDFDGYWEREAGQVRFNLVADEYPWIFKVNSGTLTVQYWQNSTAELSTNVSKIRSVKGWVPANGDESNDQGLIIFYLKTDGNVYYRNYAIQSSGSKLWEYEKQITEFTGTVVDIALFRTNDFRVGFVVQNDDDTIEYVVTERNFAGMSFKPEFISAEISDLSIDVTPIQYIDSYEEENITSGIQMERLYVCPFDTVVEITSHERLELTDEKTIKIHFSYLLECDVEKLKETMTLRNVVSDYFTIDSIFSFGSVLTITTVEDMPFAQKIILEYSEAQSYYLAFRINNNCLWDFGAFTYEVPGLPPKGYEEENITVGLDISITVLAINYLKGYEEENIKAGITDISITVTNIGGIPL